MNENVSILASVIEKCKNIVFFGGAGVSTESGIPDFRSADGIYNMEYKYPPETILSHGFFMKNTGEFFEFYKNKMVFKEARPNYAHIFLAGLETLGKDITIITQNIDGLHQKAGSQKVLELHGSVYKNRCMNCGKFFDLDYILKSKDIPLCDAENCGGVIKPEVVLYEEPLNEEVIENALKSIKSAELLIVGGTSLNVYPAAGLIRYFKGNTLALINKSATFADSTADIVIREPIGQVFETVAKEMGIYRHKAAP